MNQTCLTPIGRNGQVSVTRTHVKFLSPLPRSTDVLIRSSITRTLYYKLLQLINVHVMKLRRTLILSLSIKTRSLWSWWNGPLTPCISTSRFAVAYTYSFSFTLVVFSHEYVNTSLSGKYKFCCHVLKSAIDKVFSNSEWKFCASELNQRFLHV